MYSTLTLRTVSAVQQYIVPPFSDDPSKMEKDLREGSFNAYNRLKSNQPPQDQFISSKFQFFNDQNGQEGGTASLCQISSKSLELRLR